jgi:imidazole glycerol-phosphate synthase subunit HisH
VVDLVVLDYGSGNLRSAERALARVGAAVSMTADLDRAAAADGLIVPGVGAYAACMAGIDAIGAGPMIADRVAAGRPMLGICVGFQILFAAGEEHGVITKGLGLFGGTVRRLQADRVPHMGWNTVDAPVDSVLFAGIDPAARFYFVHSYAAVATDPGDDGGAPPPRVATTMHGEPFVAAAESVNGVLAGTQFHPEKSGDVGATLLRNWVAGVAER